MTEIDRSIAGHCIVLTGGSKGIGREMALALVRCGANVIVSGRNQRDLDAVERAAEETGPGKITGVCADVRVPQDCDRVVNISLSTFGRVDALVNNAGVALAGISPDFQSAPPKFWEVEFDPWRVIVDTNLCGPFLMTRLAVPIMLRSGRGRIINISSSPKVMRRPGWSPYGASKAALESLSVVWAQELAGTGVTVNIARPGGKVDTGILPGGNALGERREGYLPPTVMSDLIVWLVSDASADVTGRRFNAQLWDASLPASQASQRAMLRYPEQPHLF